jgi:hypothetical protein
LAARRPVGWVSLRVWPGWSSDVAEAVDEPHDRVSGFRFTDVATPLELPRLERRASCPVWNAELKVDRLRSLLRQV